MDNTQSPAPAAPKDVCSCGVAADHVIARRSTFDGKHVLLWSDGSLTWGMGYAIKGAAQPRTSEQRARALRAGWLVIGEICIYDADEVSGLIAAARWAADRDGLPGTMRARLKALRAPRGPRPVWEVLETDRDGKPTLRVWKLPRLGGYAGLAIWHERGQYSVMREMPGRRAVYEPTGFVRSTLSEIVALLPTLRACEVQS